MDCVLVPIYEGTDFGSVKTQDLVLPLCTFGTQHGMYHYLAVVLIRQRGFKVSH